MGVKRARRKVHLDKQGCSRYVEYPWCDLSGYNQKMLHLPTKSSTCIFMDKAALHLLSPDPGSTATDLLLRKFWENWFWRGIATSPIHCMDQGITSQLQRPSRALLSRGLRQSPWWQSLCDFMYFLPCWPWLQLYARCFSLELAAINTSKKTPPFALWLWLYQQRSIWPVAEKNKIKIHDILQCTKDLNQQIKKRERERENGLSFLCCIVELGPILHPWMPRAGKAVRDREGSWWLGTIWGSSWRNLARKVLKGNKEERVCIRGGERLSSTVEPLLKVQSTQHLSPDILMLFRAPHMYGGLVWDLWDWAKVVGTGLWNSFPWRSSGTTAEMWGQQGICYANNKEGRRLPPAEKKEFKFRQWPPTI